MNDLKLKYWFAVAFGFASMAYVNCKMDIAMPEGKVTVVGKLDPEKSMVTIRSNANQMRHCYEQLLQKQPTAVGNITLIWKLAADGKVKSISVGKTDFTDKLMQTCIVRKIEHWQFPVTSDGRDAQLEYTFRFSRYEDPLCDRSPATGGVGGQQTRHHPRMPDIRMPESKLVVRGELDVDDAMQVMRMNMGHMRKCYENLLDRIPEATGEANLIWTVQSNGIVKNVTISKTTFSDNLMKVCIVSKLKRWDFPKPTDGRDAQLEYNFQFKQVLSSGGRR